ncbi:hypothetical protein NKH48_17580 [Mesorhizobium sp. M1233]|uniref:AfsR/SARP family transcriptional regulator n=1 Tax=unclassified Mesorhizobium TaxID=325217 RepID=UPI003338BFB3
MLGGFAVRGPGFAITTKLARTSVDLLGYLAVNGKTPQRREKVSELLWPDRPEHQSRSALSTAIWRIDKAFSEAGFDDSFSIEVRHQSTIALALGTDVRIDCVELAGSVEDASRELQAGLNLSESVRHRLIDALAAWAGDFLEGSRSDWAAREQERFRSIRIRGLIAMMRDYAAKGMIEYALECGSEVLAVDELREATQREVMWLYVMNGQRCKAIIQYRLLKQRLRDELAVDPMPDTTHLYQHILDGGDAPSAFTPTSVTGILREHEQRRARIYSAISAIPRPDA